MWQFMMSRQQQCTHLDVLFKGQVGHGEFALEVLPQYGEANKDKLLLRLRHRRLLVELHRNEHPSRDDVI